MAEARDARGTLVAELAHAHADAPTRLRLGAASRALRATLPRLGPLRSWGDARRGGPTA